MLLAPGIFQRDGSVEDQLPGDALFIQAEVGEAFELVTVVRFRLCQRRFAFRGDHLERLRVQVLPEIRLHHQVRGGR